MKAVVRIFIAVVLAAIMAGAIHDMSQADQNLPNILFKAPDE
jgi:hypothetical protein